MRTCFRVLHLHLTFLRNPQSAVTGTFEFTDSSLSNNRISKRNTFLLRIKIVADNTVHTTFLKIYLCWYRLYAIRSNLFLSLVHSCRKYINSHAHRNCRSSTVSIGLISFRTIYATNNRHIRCIFTCNIQSQINTFSNGFSFLVVTVNSSNPQLCTNLTQSSIIATHRQHKAISCCRINTGCKSNISTLLVKHIVLYFGRFYADFFCF